MARAPISEGDQRSPSAPLLEKPYLPRGCSLDLGWWRCSLDSLAGRGPELVLWDQL